MRLKSNINFCNLVVYQPKLCSLLSLHTIDHVSAREDEFDLVKRSAEIPSEFTNELSSESEESRYPEEDKKSLSDRIVGYGKRPKLDLSRLDKNFRKQNMVDPSWLAGFGKRFQKIKSKSKFDPTWMVGAFGKRK